MAASQAFSITARITKYNMGIPATYDIEVTLPRGTKTLRKRFIDFQAMQTEMGEEAQSLPPIPPQGSMSQISASAREFRQLLLQSFLAAVLQRYPQCENEPLARFLELTRADLAASVGDTSAAHGLHVDDPVEIWSKGQQLWFKDAVVTKMSPEGNIRVEYNFAEGRSMAKVILAQDIAENIRHRGAHPVRMRASTRVSRQSRRTVSWDDAAHVALMPPLYSASDSPPAVVAAEAQLPEGLPRVCVLGSTAFQEAVSEDAVAGVASRCAVGLWGKAVFLTGGMPGVQEVFAKHLGQRFPHLFHLVPQGKMSGYRAAPKSAFWSESAVYSIGADVRCGEDLSQRAEAFSLLGNVYLTFEGGPGVAKEAKAAFLRGATIIPVKGTGGASAGMFGFPPEALQKPEWAPQHLWDQLSNTPVTSEVSDAILELIACRLGVDHTVPAGGWATEVTRLLEVYAIKAAELNQLERAGEDDGDGAFWPKKKPADPHLLPESVLVDPQEECERLRELIDLKQQGIRLWYGD